MRILAEQDCNFRAFGWVLVSLCLQRWRWISVTTRVSCEGLVVSFEGWIGVDKRLREVFSLSNFRSFGRVLILRFLNRCQWVTVTTRIGCELAGCFVLGVN